jgi:hypothetical protein
LQNGFELFQQIIPGDPMAYAENTSVSVEKSKAEIERTLQRYGASQFISGWDAARAYIGFTMAGRMIRFSIELPPRDADEFRRTPGRGTKRTPEKAMAAWEQACRQRLIATGQWDDD